MSRTLIAAALTLTLTAFAPPASTAGQATDESAVTLALSAGRQIFRQFCAPCHGLGKGDGPIASMVTASPLLDLTQLKRRSQGEFPVEALAAMLAQTAHPKTPAHGSQMPLWGPTFQAIDGSPTLGRARITNLLAYIESIQH
ncbi:MAG: hypothetical protein A3I61_03815 [Acidobacteria bacterium RIFCSPLOWO2_02_FULL_68_18]|nr:MAG: hypothetical protein A3I61_03815 [Acidobacteria bacterium RIFCSPLOWO2_02_FULL_68_18]OFW52168.1 MAG: hypothetical protein A3G77_08120 [Acidobacteria bacterium RIFCSPLOWO2_12_FULL_68_19]